MGNGQQKPVATFRSFGIEATVWQQEEHKFNVTIRKTYKPKDGKDYKETNTFFPEELPRLAMVTNEAYKFIYLKRTS